MDCTSRGVARKFISHDNIANMTPVLCTKFQKYVLNGTENIGLLLFDSISETLRCEVSGISCPMYSIFELELGFEDIIATCQTRNVIVRSTQPVRLKDEHIKIY